MQRVTRLLLILLALVCGAGLITATVNGLSAGDQVYTVAQVKSGLRHDRPAWAGRTVLVRGSAGGISCAGSRCLFGLADSMQQTNGAGQIGITFGAEDPLLAFLRRVPLLGRIVPAAQAPHFEASALYRVRILSQSTCLSWCAQGGFPSADAILIDAAPYHPSPRGLSAILIRAVPIQPTKLVPVPSPVSGGPPPIVAP